MATRKIALFKGYKRLFQRVQLTKKALKMFPGEPMGTLIRFAGDGRWIVKRDGNKNPDYWAKGFWKRVRVTRETTTEEQKSSLRA